MLALFIMPFISPVVSFLGLSGENAAIAKVNPPVFSTAPSVIGGEDEITGPPPEDPTLYLTVPKLGVYGHTVANDDSAAALDAGAIKIPSTGFPWQENANPYIAGHRIGYRDTESYYQFLELPSMQNGDEVILEDAKGRQYVYAVTRVFAVEPRETWVTNPVPGKDMVTLQTCVESVDDWQTVGSNLLYFGPDTGRLIVRAERV
ncbi:MAG: class E sortase [Rubrobacteraceae bacterium]